MFPSALFVPHAHRIYKITSFRLTLNLELVQILQAPSACRDYEIIKIKMTRRFKKLSSSVESIYYNLQLSKKESLLCFVYYFNISRAFG